VPVILLSAKKVEGKEARNKGGGKGRPALADRREGAIFFTRKKKKKEKKREEREIGHRGLSHDGRNGYIPWLQKGRGKRGMETEEKDRKRKRHHAYPSTVEVKRRKAITLR